MILSHTSPRVRSECPELCGSEVLWEKWEPYPTRTTHIVRNEIEQLLLIAPVIGYLERGVRTYDKATDRFYHTPLPEGMEPEYQLHTNMPIAVYLYGLDDRAEWMVFDLDSGGGYPEGREQATKDLHILARVLEYCQVPWFADVSENGGYHAYAHLDQRRSREEISKVLLRIAEYLPSMDRSVMTGSWACIRPTGAVVKSRIGSQYPLHPWERTEGVLSTRCSAESWDALSSGEWELLPELPRSMPDPASESSDSLSVKTGNNPRTPGGISESGRSGLEALVGGYLLEEVLDPFDVTAEDLFVVASDSEIMYTRRSRLKRRGAGYTMPERARHLVLTGEHSEDDRYGGDDSRARQAILAYLTMEGYTTDQLYGMVEDKSPLMEGYTALVLNGNHGTGTRAVLKKLRSDSRKLASLEVVKNGWEPTAPETQRTPAPVFVRRWITAARLEDVEWTRSLGRMVVEGIARVAAKQGITGPGEVFEMSYRHLARHAGIGTKSAYYLVQDLRKTGLIDLVKMGKDEEGSTWILTEVDPSLPMAEDPLTLDPVWATMGPFGKAGPALRDTWDALETESTASGVAEAIGVSRPTASKYLSMLREAGIVESVARRWHKKSIWDLPAPMIAQAMALMDRFAEETMAETEAYRASRSAILKAREEGRLRRHYAERRGEPRRSRARLHVGTRPRRRVTSTRPSLDGFGRFTGYAGSSASTSTVVSRLSVSARGDPRATSRGDPRQWSGRNRDGPGRRGVAAISVR